MRSQHKDQRTDFRATIVSLFSLRGDTFLGFLSLKIYHFQVTKLEKLPRYLKKKQQKKKKQKKKKHNFYKRGCAVLMLIVWS